MMPIQDEIADLFADRFPRYALLWPSWPDEDSPLSSDGLDWLRALPLHQIQVLYLYGLGDGRAAVELSQWLHEDSDRRLIFLEPREGRIVHFLHQPCAKEVLALQQVEIFHLPANRARNRLLLELADRYPTHQIFIAPNPGLTSLERQAFRRLKLQLLRKTALSHANYVDRLYSHILLSNLLKNLPRLPGAFYGNHLKDAFRNIPLIICGAGPSLNDSIGALRKLENRAIIMGGGSAIAALSSQGVDPHLAVAIDPNRSEFLRLMNSCAFETPFFFSTRLNPDSFATCNGPFGYLRSGMAGVLECWFEEALGLTDPMLGDVLSLESLSVTMLCVALSQHFGCNPILFTGIDLAYTQNRRYAKGVLATGDESDESLQPADRRLPKRDRLGKPVQSALRWVMEASAISQFAKLQRQRRWINCTSGGLEIQGLENASLDPDSPIFSQEQDLRGMIHLAIRRFPMPANSQSILTEKTKELRQSLDIVLSHLAILVQNESPGKCALAEIEMKEELAYRVLFFDIEMTLRKAEQKPERFWKNFQEMALACRVKF
jgi:hypothetical protein